MPTVSLAYSVLYAVGFTPWEEIAELPLVHQQVAALLARDEQDRRPPFGPALDLGCGSGSWSVTLAQRGWQVTGVDSVPRALRRAREHARNAGIDVRLIRGDVTRLHATDVGTDFRLLLDFGLFHDELSDSQRAAMGREVTAVAAPGASLLMMAWSPARRRLLPRGAGRADIAAAYPTWTILDEQPFDVADAPFYKRVKNPDPRFYHLRRN